MATDPGIRTKARAMVRDMQTIHGCNAAQMIAEHAIQLRMQVASKDALIAKLELEREHTARMKGAYND
jgi:hypothetical protein